jgi:hypothetical protein
VNIISYAPHCINETKQPAPKLSSKTSNNKTNIKRPTSSANKRRRFNNRFIQKAKLKSRQVATNMIKYATRFTRNALILSNMIRGSVASAVHRMHVLLEETHIDSTNVMDGKAPIRNESTAPCPRQQQSTAAKNAPPLNAFSPKWVGAQLMKQQTKSYVGKSMLSGRNKR